MKKPVRLSQPCKHRASVLVSVDASSDRRKVKAAYAFSKMQGRVRHAAPPVQAAAAETPGRGRQSVAAADHNSSIKAVMSLWNQHKSNIAMHEGHLLQLQLDTYNALNVIPVPVDANNVAVQSKGSETPRRSLVQDLIRVDSSLLSKSNLAADYEFQAPVLENNTVQLCAWDDNDPSPTGMVSGFVNVRSLLNVNMQLDAAARLASCSPDTLGNEIPFVARIMGNPTVHALRNATSRRPVVHAAMDALQHVFQVSKDKVKFTDLHSAQPKYSVPYGEKMSFVHTVCTNSRMQCLDDDAPLWAKDMQVEHVVVSDHNIVRSRRFIAEAVTVTNRITKQKVHFVVTNSALQRQPETVPMAAKPADGGEPSLLHAMESSVETTRKALDTDASPGDAPSTFAHVFGLGSLLVGESRLNMLHENLKHLRGTADSIMHGVLCMRAISKQAARSGPDSLLAKSFAVCNNDPTLSLANVFPVVDHQGMRVLHLTLNYANKTCHPLNVCIVLTAVKRCSDQDTTSFFPAASASTGTVYEPNIKRQETPVAARLPFVRSEAHASAPKPVLPSVDISSPAVVVEPSPPPPAPVVVAAPVDVVAAAVVAPAAVAATVAVAGAMDATTTPAQAVVASEQADVVIKAPAAAIKAPAAAIKAPAAAIKAPAAVAVKPNPTVAKARAQTPVTPARPAASLATAARSARSTSAPLRERPVQLAVRPAPVVSNDSFLDSLMNNTQRVINDLVRKPL